VSRTILDERPQWAKKLGVIRCRGCFVWTNDSVFKICTFCASKGSNEMVRDLVENR
jgi:hypothetical protein